MTTLRFEIMATCRLVNHALRSPEWDRSFYDEAPARPQLVFVKDEGIYLMSNGLPSLGANGEPIAKGVYGKRAIVYAEDFDPTARDRMDVWDDARDAVGGDDFAEYIDIEPMLPIPENATAFYIKVTTKTIECGWELAVPTRAKVRV